MLPASPSPQSGNDEGAEIFWLRGEEEWESRPHQHLSLRQQQSILIITRAVQAGEVSQRHSPPPTNNNPAIIAIDLVIR